MTVASVHILLKVFAQNGKNITYLNLLIVKKAVFSSTRISIILTIVEIKYKFEIQTQL